MKFAYRFDESIALMAKDVQNVTVQAAVADGVLKLSGKQTAPGAAHAYTTIDSDLRIPIDKDTKLSYIIVPYENSDDGAMRKYPSMYIAVDLLFDDGTRLSRSNVLDENRVGASPVAQGRGKAMYPHQQNEVIIPLSAFAGKTVTEISVGYEDFDGADGAVFSATLDDIVITNIPRRRYEKPIDYVWTTRGSNPSTPYDTPVDSRGMAHPATALPHGFNLWSPENRIGTAFGGVQGHNGPIYDYKYNFISAFRCGHQANFHVGDPAFWKFMVTNGGEGKTTYSHDNELATAHYYGVTFDKVGGQAAGTKVEMTPTNHGAAIRFTYDRGLGARGVELENVHILRAAEGVTIPICTEVDTICIDAENASFAVTVDAKAYHPHAWAHGIDTMYVYGRFDAPIERAENGTAFFAEAACGETVVTMTLATSFISMEQAKRNYELELVTDGETMSFDAVYAAAEAAWMDILGNVEIEGATEEQLVAFYSNLYRLCLYPMSMGEYTGEGQRGGYQYQSPYGHGIQDGDLYYGNGFWDTFKTVWPAFSLFDRKHATDIFNGMLCHYEDNGWIPRWNTPAGIDCMIGTSSDIIFGDALARGVTFDLDTAYAAALQNALMSTYNGSDGRAALHTGLFLGYIDSDHLATKSVSWTLDNAINDFGVAQMAKAKGDTELSDYFTGRALTYSHLFDREGQWFRSKNAAGRWAFGNVHADSGYEESDAWINAFGAFHDGQGMVNLYGGRESLTRKLDTYFGGADIYYGRVGRFNIDNEPCLHIPYVYLYTGRPDRTQELIRLTLMRCFNNNQIGAGYAGDDDNGAMSSWYLFGALGLYPLNLGSGELAFGSPLFTKIRIRLDNGHTLTVSAPANSPENVYVNGVTINGRPYDKLSILQSELTSRDTEIVFDMVSKPSDWGTAEYAAPSSITTDHEIPALRVDMTTPHIQFTESVPAVGDFENWCFVSGGQVAPGLFDNDSLTAEILSAPDGHLSVCYHFETPKRVDYYTLTSGSDTSRVPVGASLFASRDGKTWIQLDKRDDLVFPSKTFTLPFAVAEPEYYRCYRLDLTTTKACIELAEIELLGIEGKAITSYLLEETARKYASVEHRELPHTLRTAISDACLDAMALTDTPTPSDRELSTHYRHITDAVAEATEWEQARGELRDILFARKDMNARFYTTGSWQRMEDAYRIGEQLTATPEATIRAFHEAKDEILSAVLAMSGNYANSLTVGATVRANQSQGGNESPEGAVDGNDDTKWCATCPDNGFYWLEVDLGRACAVDDWLVRSACSESMVFLVRDFQLQVKDENGAWITVAEVQDNDVNHLSGEFEKTVCGRHFRLLIKASTCGDGNCRVQEFHLFSRGKQ